MILVCVGASRPFDRLIREVDKIAKETHYQFVAQIGYTKYEPEHVEYFRFKPHGEIVNLIKKSELVITHGGFGTIYDCLSLGKSVIAVPKTFELDQTDNDQSEIVKFLESKGKLTGVYEISKLRDVLKTMNFSSSVMRFNQNITKAIREFIKKTEAKKYG